MGTKVLAIGLDGATPELIDRWTSQGYLPNLARMCQQGVYGKLRSTYPPISPAAWATFATGYDPGNHGTFDFRNYDPRRYSCFADSIVDSSAIAGKTVWDLVGASGQKVGVITVPITYPAWPVNGFMISGYPTPDAARSFAFPQTLGSQIPPLTEDSTFFKSAAHPDVLRELIRLTKLRTDVSLDQLRHDDFGLFIMVIGATDRAHHDWWKFIDPQHPAYNAQEAALYGDYILQVYQCADECIGRFLDVVSEDTTTIVLSDHGGMAHPKYYFGTNSWLRSLGLLTPIANASQHQRGVRTQFKRLYRTQIRRLPYLEKVYRALPHQLKQLAISVDSQVMMNLDVIDWSRTQAYRFPMYPPVEGIMLNVIGRQEQGCVQPGAEYEQIRSRILDEASRVRDPNTGEPVFVEAHRREDIYHGARVDIAPDIILATQDCYKCGTGVDELISDVPLDVLTKLSGVHRMDGIIVAQGPHVRHGQTITDARILDIAPTLLFLLGMPIPSDMGGKPLKDLFDEEYVKGTKAQYTDERVHTDVSSDANGYSPEEEESIRVKLEGLGYL